MTIYIVEEEADGYLPEGFLGPQHNEVWQENAIMVTWMLLLVGYMLSLAPILSVTFFFWILAMEWSLDSTLYFSMESFDQEHDSDDDASDHHEGEFSYLMDRLQSSKTKKAIPSKRSNRFLGFFRKNKNSSSGSHPQTAAVDPNSEVDDELDSPHVHHHKMPNLVKADWN